MSRVRILSLAALAGFSIPVGASAAAPAAPPVALVQPVTDDYFGTKITDPYRWMEAEPKPQFFDYLHQENDYARAVLARIPGRDDLLREEAAVTSLASRVRMVALAGGKIFFLRRDAGGQIDRLFVRDAAGHETMLVDPAALGSSTVHAEIDQFAPSIDGSKIAYGVSSGGSENSTLHVIDTATKAVHPDSIDRAQFASVAWLPDGGSFYFTRLAPGYETKPPVEQYAHMKVYRHVLGADPASDAMVLDSDHLPFSFSGRAIFPAIGVSPGTDYALAVMADGVSPEVAVYTMKLADLLSGGAHWAKVADQSDDVTGFALRGNHIDLLTHQGAPRFKIIETGLDAPDLATAKTVVAQPDGVVTALAAGSDALYYATRDGAIFHLHRLANGTSTADTVKLPFAGTITVPGESNGGLITDPQRPGLLVDSESWVRPHVWLQYDPASKKLTDSHILPGFPRDLSAYQSIETSATAPDGTKIPLSIVIKKGIKRDGKRPTYLVGYGSYGLSYDPAFSPNLLPWLDHGGVYAVAHVRGGGEGGQAWHDAGKIATKQNTIHDFIACAEALVKLHYTDSAHLAGEGTSAGGILIGGAITQRPDLFRAALIRVGATNILREEYTAGGPANIPEFGTVTNKDQFPAMLAMDANNHVVKGVAYPAVMLTGGANDPRVTVWIPAKMTAKLQAATSSGRPVLFRVEFDAGHGMGSTRAQRDAETADELAFLLWQFGEPGFQPAS